MKIMVVGGGGREHAIIKKLKENKSVTDIYALPGNVDNKTSEVTNLLIKNGAKLITSPDDIIADLEFVYLGKINPFLLKNKLDVNMNDVFRELEICCVTPSDDIFSPFPSKKKEKKQQNEADTKIEVKVEDTPKPEIPIENMNFDKNTLNVYKKIPTSGACSLDSLADEETPMHVVMKALFKLEMGNFVTMLPGETVKRNLN